MESKSELVRELLKAFDELTPKGQREAVKRVYEMGRMPEWGRTYGCEIIQFQPGQGASRY